MSPRPLQQSLGNRLRVITLALMTLMLIIQFAMQRYFIDALRNQYMINMDVTIDQVVSEIKDVMQKQENACTYIIGEQEVSDYAATQDAKERYRLAFSHVRPIVRVATQNLTVDHVIIYDVSNAWYQYTGVMEHAYARQIRDRYQSLPEVTSTAEIFGGKLYFCSFAPLHAVRSRAVHQVGLVAVLTDGDRLRSMLLPPKMLGSSTVLLHDGSTVLFSTSSDKEGASLADIMESERQFYHKSETILPGLTVTVAIPRREVFPQQTGFVVAFLLVALCFAVAFMVTPTLSTRWFSRPIGQVIDQMEGLTQAGGRLEDTGVSHIDGLVHGVNALMERLENTNRQYITAQQTLYEAELERQQTALHLLKKQINAHFLYNSLMGISVLAGKDEARRAGELAEGVALLMRYAHSAQAEANVFEEMQIIQRYVDIMNARYGDRFACTYDVDDRLCEFKILKLLLQPLVENALVHGLEGKIEDATLSITGEWLGDRLRFTICDNGMGIPAEKLGEINRQLADIDTDYQYEGIQGISLVNIEKRVRTAYGPDFGLTVESEIGAFTRVVLVIPARVDE